MSFKVTVQPSNHEFTVEDGQSVLDGALAAGIVLPYSCRNGACPTCKGKVLEGSYDAGSCPEQILSPEDLEQGSTLFCHARPSSALRIEAHEIRMARDIQIRMMQARVLGLETPADDVLSVQLPMPAAAPIRSQHGQPLTFHSKNR